MKTVIYEDGLATIEMHTDGGERGHLAVLYDDHRDDIRYWEWFYWQREPSPRWQRWLGMKHQTLQDAILAAYAIIPRLEEATATTRAQRQAAIATAGAALEVERILCP